MSELSPEQQVAQALTEPATEPVIETPVAVVENTGHPAWQEILSAIPESLHETVRPTLEKWDNGVTERLSKVQSQYDPYKPIVEQGITPEDLLTGNQLLQALNSDPQAFYNNLKDYYKFGDSGQGQASQESSTEEVDLSEYGDLTQHPQFKQMQAAQQQMLTQMQAAQTAQQEKDAEIWLSSRQVQIADVLKEKGLEPDWDYILNKAQTIASKTGNYDNALNEARDAYIGMVGKYRAPIAAPVAPSVMPPNGAVPASNFNPASLKEDERKTLLAQMLTQAFKE